MKNISSLNWDKETEGNGAISIQNLLSKSWIMSYIALNYIMMCFYTYSVKKIALYSKYTNLKRKERLTCCFFGQNREWWWKNHRISTRINKI